MTIKYRILIAEDEINTREILGQLIKILGYDSILVCNADEAILEYSQNDNIHLIFMDNDMPNQGDGIRAAQKIRELETQLKRNTKIVSISGTEEIVEFYLKNGVKIDGQMRKPFKTNQIKETIEQFLYVA